MLRFIAGWCGLAVDTFGYEACWCCCGWLPAPTPVQVRSRQAGNTTLHVRTRVEAEDCERTPQVGQQVDRLGIIHHQTFENAHAVGSAVNLEIPDGEKVDVRGVVPLVRQFLRHRHASSEYLQPVPPVAEVRKRDDSLAADPKH